MVLPVTIFHCILLIYWYLLIKNMGRHTPGCIVVNRYIEIRIPHLSPHTDSHICLLSRHWKDSPFSLIFTTCHPGVVFPTNTYIRMHLWVYVRSADVLFISGQLTAALKHAFTNRYLFYETLFLCFNSWAIQPYHDNVQGKWVSISRTCSKFPQMWLTAWISQPSEIRPRQKKKKRPVYSRHETCTVINCRGFRGEL